MIIGLNYTNSKTIDDLNDQMCKVIKEINFLTTGNIDADNIRANSITADLITAGAITTVAIADGSITTAKLTDGAITGVKISDGVISNAKLIDNTIQGIKLQAGTLTDTQLANAAVTSAKIASSAITSTLLADLAVTGQKIANTTISGNKIMTGTITANNIAANTITGNEIAANTITAGKLNVATLSAITADLGTITAGSISGTTITGGTIRTSTGTTRIEIINDKLTGYASGSTSIELRPDLVNPYIKCGNIKLYDYGPTSQPAKIEINGAALALTNTGGSQQHGQVSSTGNLYLDGLTVYINNNDVLTTINGKANSATTLSGYGITDGVNTSDVVTSATANKILKLDGSAKLPADITGNAATATNVSWSGITSKPTTLSTFGITDAYTKTTSDNKYGGNLVYNPTTKLLKLFAPDGTQLASVDISGS